MIANNYSKQYTKLLRTGVETPDGDIVVECAECGYEQVIPQVLIGVVRFCAGCGLPVLHCDEDDYSF